MNLLSSWKESLRLCLPEQAKLFFLVTVRSLGIFYYTLVTYWWWLILLFIGERVSIVLWPNTAVGTWAFALRIALFLFLATFLYSSMFFTALPSLLPKSGRFYINAFKRFWYFLIIAPFLNILVALFMLDSDGSLRGLGKSIVRGLGMVVYNLPIYVLLSALLMAGWFGILVAIELLVESMRARVALESALRILLFPVYLMVFTNLYSKKLHEQSDLYYPQPK